MEQSNSTFTSVTSAANAASRKKIVIGIILGFSAVALLCFAIALTRGATSMNSTHFRGVQVSEVQNGYKLASVYTSPDNMFISAILSYNGDPFYIKAGSPMIQFLNLTVKFQDPTHFNVHITDANNTRWEIPQEEPFAYNVHGTYVTIDNGICDVTFESSPFSFQITRKDTKEVIFDTSVGNFIYSDYYIEISTSLPKPEIYGFAERTYYLQLPSGTYTLWNRDVPAQLEDGTTGHQIYGYHPVHMFRESKVNNFNMLYLRSSNAMDVVIDTSKKLLTYKVVGGVLDFHFFIGDTNPETSVQAYHDYIGGWAQHPFWSFGWQQSRWGYRRLSDLEDAVNSYNTSGLPLDVIWSDIDYLHAYWDFTIDEDRFPPAELKQFLQDSKKRWVAIIDCGIGMNETYDWYQKGKDMDIYIKNNEGKELKGQVWPGYTTYPDVMNPATEDYFSQGLATLYAEIKFDGIWTDMNEPANFCNGNCETGPSPSIMNDLPYTPGNRPLYTGTLDLDAKVGNTTHFNAHPFYGFLQNRVIHNYLKKNVSPLTFILTRSNFVGSGKYAAHWTADNVANWTFLKYSVAQMITYNILGVPMVGVDICGYQYSASEELCARWMQIGSLNPFSRSHHTSDGVDQAPYALGPTVLETSKQSLFFRYSILKHYYSLFLARKGKGTIFRPLFFEFPDDENLFDAKLGYSETHVMLGESLLVSPVLDEGVTVQDVYLPKGRWFDFINGTLMQDYSDKASTHPFPASLNSTLPIFIRGGYIIGRQCTKNLARTDDLGDDYKIHIALGKKDDGSVFAKGHVLALTNMSDENVVNRCIDSNCFLNIDVTETNESELSVSFNAGNAESVDSITLTGFMIYGAKLGASSASILLNGEAIEEASFIDGSDSVDIATPDITIKSGDKLTINFGN